MKKIDKLVIGAFIGPFILTTCVVVFIFLIRFLMMYFSEFVGKDLGIDVFLRLFFYFSLMTVPIALPLATLLSSLMCFGNLGEYTELTAIKSAGISINRALRPALIFAIGISIFSFWYNNQVIPWANLKGFSLLWDVKTTKVTMNIQDGIFYKDIPGYTIKVKKKFVDGKTLKGVTIYDHRKNTGNQNVTLADSGQMYTILNNSYLVFELFNGNSYVDYQDHSTTGANNTPFVRNQFKHNKLVMSLESFGMKRTDESQFRYSEFMKNIWELEVMVDSLRKDVQKQNQDAAVGSKGIFSYAFKKSTTKADSIKKGAWIDAKIKTAELNKRHLEVFAMAGTQVTSVKDSYKMNRSNERSKSFDANKAAVEYWHKFTQAFACFVMFLIGAALGAIVKKGGFGMPVVLSIGFFILMYVLTQFFDKNAKEEIMNLPFAVWMPNTILLAIGIYFVLIARNDSRLFEVDNYKMWLDRLRHKWKRKPSVSESES